MSTESRLANVNDAVRTELIRDLVEQYPEVMPVLSGYGIDVCCGGAHTVPDAAKAHGHDPDALIDEVVQAVSREEH
jgi:iron-sulfur cluster repair protein YtfE (RIC family)